jgi:hypothetical protein
MNIDALVKTFWYVEVLYEHGFFLFLNSLREKRFISASSKDR